MVCDTFYFYSLLGLPSITNDGNGTASLEYLNLIVQSINTATTTTATTTTTTTEQQQPNTEQSNL